MVVAPSIGFILLEAALRGLNRGAEKMHTSAVRLTHRGEWRQAFFYALGAAYLDEVADWLSRRLT
jgi:hypothetical protein